MNGIDEEKKTEEEFADVPAAADAAVGAEDKAEPETETSGREAATEGGETCASGEACAEDACAEDACAEKCAEKECAEKAFDASEEEKPCREGREHERGHCRRELEKAREEIKALKAEAEDLKRKWYAVTAEYENYRRRTQNQSAQRYTEGRNDVVAELFPVGDNLERALSACADEKTAQGVEMVLKSYKKVLEGEGIEEIDPTGRPFDAAEAEAIMAVPAEKGEEPGIVRQVYVKGYKRGEKVLRYAQVIVTQ